jgi:signal transduction histidine kinase/PAS domain-containing protein
MLQFQIINISLSIATSALSILLAAHARRQRHVQGALAFIGLVLAVAWVTWWYSFEAAVGTNLDAYMSLSKLEYVGLSFIPALWLGFALTFSGRERILSFRMKIALAVIPIVTILLAFTNEFHRLIWNQPRFDMSYGSPVFTAQYGAWFWVFVVYSYVIFLFGSLFLIRYAATTWRLYRAQALVVLIGTAFPWISNLLTIFHNLNPFPYLYLNAIFLGASIACFGFALFRLRLLDVAPVAYDTILNNVPEGIIVVDLKNRILAINTYIKPYLDNPHRDPIGQPVNEALSHYAPYFDALKDMTNYKGEFEVDGLTLEIRVSEAVDRQGKRRGRIFIISDITAKAQAEKTQRAEQQFFETMNTIGRNLSSSLDVARVTSLILESLDEFVPHTSSNIMLIEEDGFTTRPYQHRNYPPEEAAFLENLTFDYSHFPLFLHSVETLTPFIVADKQDSPYPDGLESVHSFASMPLLMEDRVVGFLNIDSRQPAAIQPEMLKRLQIFGQEASLAIKNARLYEQTYRQAEELKRRVNSLTVTQQVYKEIGFSLNINLLLELVLDATLRVSAADSGYIALARENHLELTQHYGDYDQDQLNAILENQAGIVGQAIHEGRMMADQVPSALVSGVVGTQAQIALPLFASRETDAETFYGVIVLETKNPKRFTEDRIQLLELIADRVAVALNNSHLVDALRDRASELEVLYDKLSYLEKFKSDMIRIAAHDLKNPLHVIRNYLSMLVEPADFEPDLEKVYAAMVRSSDRMLQIIQDFLSLDRIEQAAKKQTMEPFDLRKVVTSALGEYIGRATQKSQQLDYSVPETPCVVVGDASQIREAVVNFVSNAIKYTQEGGNILVTLKQGEHYAQLEVSDNGYGIPSEEQEKLFQPFFRARSSETAREEGNGLGLHLTKNIIERQGGKLIFESTYHKGSTFGFQLPLYEPEASSAVAS